MRIFYPSCFPVDMIADISSFLSTELLLNNSKRVYISSWECATSPILESKHRTVFFSFVDEATLSKSEYISGTITFDTIRSVFTSSLRTFSDND